MEKDNKRPSPDGGKGAVRYEQLPISNNFIFCKVMEDADICREVLEVLLGVGISRVERVETEKTLLPAERSKGVRYDVYVESGDEVFDVEMQMADTGDLALRARYYQAAIDTDQAYRGTHYSDLKRSYILFLCPFDVFGKGEPVYTFRNACGEAEGLEMGDRRTIVFYNFNGYGKLEEGARRRLLEYISTGRAGTPLTEGLRRRVEYAHLNPMWRKDYMTLDMMIIDARREGEKQGLAEGARRNALQTARNLVVAGVPVQTVADCTGLSMEEVERLQQTPVLA